MKPIITVEGVSKRYTIGKKESYGSLRDEVMDALASPFRRLFGGGDGAEDPSVWALKDVSFDVFEGDVLGIIGRNGAGKSTLLKILSRITEPTGGRIEMRGRIASLLEVGTGFHPELTGRENIFMNGALLGMSSREIKDKFDEIVAFSEIEKFLDTPVKRYSSGMYVRLAFAVAAHLEPEILVIDEVLAVGDAAFQRKCLGKMGDVAKGGRTVLFVSHNMAAVNDLCTKALVLSDGSLTTSGKPDIVIEKYLSDQSSKDSHIEMAPARSSVFFTAISIRSKKKLTTVIGLEEPFIIEFKFNVKKKTSDFVVSFALFNQYGSKVFFSERSLEGDSDEGDYAAEVTVPGSFLAPGRYTITASIHRPNVEIFDLRENVISVTVMDTGSRYYMYAGKDIGSVLVDFPWRIHKITSSGPTM